MVDQQWDRPWIAAALFTIAVPVAGFIIWDSSGYSVLTGLALGAVFLDRARRVSADPDAANPR